MNLVRTFLNYKKNYQKFSPQILAIFILSIFIGVILGFVIKQWVFVNIKKIQLKQEALRLERLLDQNNLGK